MAKAWFKTPKATKGLKAWIHRHKSLITIAAAFLTVATFVVKDILGDSSKDRSEMLEAATNRNDLNEHFGKLQDQIAGIQEFWQAAIGTRFSEIKEQKWRELNEVARSDTLALNHLSTQLREIREIADTLPNAHGGDFDKLQCDIDVRERSVGSFCSDLSNQSYSDAPEARSDSQFDKFSKLQEAEFKAVLAIEGRGTKLWSTVLIELAKAAKEAKNRYTKFKTISYALFFASATVTLTAHFVGANSDDAEG